MGVLHDQDGDDAVCRGWCDGEGVSAFAGQQDCLSAAGRDFDFCSVDVHVLLLASA